MEKIDKKIGAWVVMDVYTYEPIRSGLVRVIGPIVDSNFLQPSEHSEMPVMATPFEDVDVGSRVKLVYFTTKRELDAFKAKKSIGFDDYGLRYFKWENDGWTLLYEE